MKVHINKSHLHQLLSDMLKIRRFEEKCAELYTGMKIRGFLHLYNGEEAIAVGVIHALKTNDAVFSTYREHGHALAKGVDMKRVMAELFGKVTGTSRGRGGSMHIFDKSHAFFGGNAIVAGALPMAVGLALAYKKQGKQDIVVCFFGEGAAAEGEFHESMNLAKLWNLPILFVCENNGYAMGTALSISESEQSIQKKAQSYGVKSAEVDGMNVVDVEAAASEVCDAIRQGEGPHLLECHTYRFRGHSMFDTQLYREQQEVERWKEKDPITQVISWLKSNDQLTDSELKDIEDKIQLQISEATLFADESEFEPVEQLSDFVVDPDYSLNQTKTEVSHG